ncbi:Asp-tRNA(Asn)/Glu-tRNA(Gln) amidotransferase subunit GatB [Holzapfeliella floricola]|uniref:Aspartyl/glutamyl-tRNA(Asn/Gln) amidotransferase subunit B n=1 Tax=Holzapfeliella floricola DSM 23037 = JCM 16512 TaxID=1423744 RepID=A0A0R2DLY8_9LACO|nr:Asp-tRNA(Asn)/Glu-tRNA(Gln) amidotransferase subunit GatB [Holzapfeliella floricola]KRN04467.1 gatB protein [Holzapfeliella floricola DSM 23037 = JCM 16512]
MNFETTIGLEVHVELKTNTKMFSPSPVQYGAEPNTNTNVIDFGYPGVLPTVNKEAYRLGIMVASAMHSNVSPYTHFDRKNYFYPDNPKAYQITQSEFPLATDGYIEIEVNGYTKKIRLEEMHVEEDAGKNTHGTDGYSSVDLNRQGTALIEIVSKPDIATPDEAQAYLEKLRQIVQFTGASDVKMEEGSMRVDTNISLRPIGQEELGEKAELKNLNSFNHVRLGLAYEEKRQTEILLAGGEIKPETRRFDETTGQTYLLRVKEGKDDYRYFPEPDIPGFHVADSWVEEIKSQIPEMPDVRRKRYVSELGIPEYDANILTQTKEMSDFFNETVENGGDAKLASNWLMGEVNAYLNTNKIDLLESNLTPENLATMIKLIKDGTISSKIAKKVFQETIKNGTEPKAWVEEKGLVQQSDPAVLVPLINDILDNNEQSIEDYKNGKDRAIGFLVGQIMKATRGQANPKVVNKILLEELDKK